MNIPRGLQMMLEGIVKSIDQEALLKQLLSHPEIQRMRAMGEQVAQNMREIRDFAEQNNRMLRVLSNEPEMSGDEVSTILLRLDENGFVIQEDKNEHTNGGANNNT